MKIAFASCICVPVFPAQPVWDWIAAEQPDHLVLLGDSIYLDINAPPPRWMSADVFAQHLHTRYSELLAQPQFGSLVRQLPPGRVHCIWDDHDFLWNDAAGAAVRADPTQREKLPLTTAFHEAFRSALFAGLPAGSFPASYNDALFWDPQQAPLGTPSRQLAADVWLHLSDGRSWRTETWLVAEAKRAMLGDAQRSRLAAQMRAAPQAIHLLASGSALAAWKRYGRDWQWLLDLAAQQRMLVLSGDIHRNEVDAFHTGGWPLHEATSSGVAVRDAVVVGQRQQNYGLLEIDADSVQVRLFKDHREERTKRRTLARTSWLPR